MRVALGCADPGVPGFGRKGSSLLSRLYDPSGGRVRVDGWDLRDVRPATLRSQVAVVLQGSMLFGVSVRENIRYGAPAASDEQIERAARLTDAHEFIETLPDGYDTVLGERGATLSGGRRQPLAIARAAARDAPIMARRTHAELPALDGASAAVFGRQSASRGPGSVGR